MDADEITRRLLGHFGGSEGWSPRDWGGCGCAACYEDMGCEVPGLFEALGLPVPEPTWVPEPRVQVPVVRIDMGDMPTIRPGNGRLFEMVSKIVDTDQFKHGTLPYSVRPTSSS